jgi:hypothetical protein
MFHFQGGAPRTRHGGCPGVAGTCARPTISRGFLRLKSLQQQLVSRAPIPSRRKLFLSLSDLHPIPSYPRPDPTSQPANHIAIASHSFTAARPLQQQPCVSSKSNPRKTTWSRTAWSTATNLGVATPHTPLSAGTHARKSCTNPHGPLHPTLRCPLLDPSQSPRLNPSPYSCNPHRLPCRCRCRLHHHLHTTATTRRLATTGKRTTLKCHRARA